MAAATAGSASVNDTAGGDGAVYQPDTYQPSPSTAKVRAPSKKTRRNRRVLPGGRSACAVSPTGALCGCVDTVTGALCGWGCLRRPLIMASALLRTSDQSAVISEPWCPV